MAIQKGFKWQNIPRFAVLTGVNGVGKTQLLDVLAKNKSIVTAQNDEGNIVNLVFPSDVNNNLSIKGLVEYKNTYITRQAQIQSLEDQINMFVKAIAREETVRLATADKVSIQKHKSSINGFKQSIINLKREITSITVFEYENELSLLSEKLGKPLEELTDEEIIDNANPFFNSLTEINDFKSFLGQEESDRNNQFIRFIKEKHFDAIEPKSKEERPFERINRLFDKFGFDYYKMQDPFPADSTRNGEIVFIGRKGEVVRYNALSSGEQMIVKFVIWAMGKDIRGRRLNTMVIDEPDAHLHPSMCNMMVRILEEISGPKEDGGSDIRVIITTHSPSTVAFSPEGSLFVMEKDKDNNRYIRPTTTEEAVKILSDGVFTYEKSLRTFHQVISTQRKNLLFVEGKTDVLHMKKAMSVLGYDLDVEIIDIHDAASLSEFIKVTPSKLLSNRTAIALFDSDDAGKKAYNSISGDESIIKNAKRLNAEQCEQHAFTLKIIAPKGLEKYCPIEFLYPCDYLKKNGLLTKRNYSEYQSLFKPTNPDESAAMNEEYKAETTLRPFVVNDSKKTSFSETVESESNPVIFQQFIPTLEVIKVICTL